MNGKSIALWVAACLWTSGGLGWGQDLRVQSLRCEYQVDPLEVETAQPRLSWILASDKRGQSQTAYQILVATSPDRLRQEQGDLWDSGKVRSDQSVQVAYAGKP